jgi:Cullin family/Anaphase promoting complex (APC) subunit 2
MNSTMMLQQQQQHCWTIVNEFWCNTPTWKSLPQRLRRLMLRIVELQNEIASQRVPTQEQAQEGHQVSLWKNNIDSRSSSNINNNVDTTRVLFVDICTMITAALLAKQPKPHCLTQSLESFFVASLTYHSSTNEEEVDNGNQQQLIDDHELKNFFLNNNEELLYNDVRMLGWMLTPSSNSDLDPTTATTTSYLLHEPLMNAICKVIEKKIRATIAGNYDNNEDDEDVTPSKTSTNATTLYQSILDWSDRTIFPWLFQYVFGIHGNSAVDLDYMHLKRRDWQRKVQQDVVHQVVAHCYWSVRLTEIFDIVTSFPDSLPAVLELKSILSILLRERDSDHASAISTSFGLVLSNDNCSSELRMQELALALRESFIRRLNHPGANTTQMIDVYIAAIQVLRILLDGHTSSSNHMNTFIAYTTEPVRFYLRHYRNDTVRCILTSLTNTGNIGCSSNNDNSNTHVLYQELRRQDTKPLEYMTLNSDDEDNDEEECPSMDWQPRPSIYSYTHHQQQQSYHYHRSSNNKNSNNKNDSDILAMLVSIYGSKELFVNEYRSMLADKLLGNLDYNTDHDVHTLELLKLRFGEMSLINAEVMIKDIEDSARLNKNIRDAFRAKKSVIPPTSTTELTNAVVVDAAIISHIFWPKLQNGPLKHHPRIQVMLDEYATIYAEQKSPRTLQWLYHLGSVQLELDVVEENHDGTASTIETKEFTCSPLLATLITHFEDEPTWTAEQLSNETNIPDYAVVKQMSYWITQRVVVYGTTFTTVASGKTPFSNNYNASEIAYTLASQADRTGTNGNAHLYQSINMMNDDDNDGMSSGYHQQAVSATAQVEEDTSLFESYILVMLTNLQQASIQKIHEMLTMMSAQSGSLITKYNQSLTKLHALLQNLCRQKKLECGPDGMYQLCKK